MSDLFFQFFLVQDHMYWLVLATGNYWLFQPVLTRKYGCTG